ncbi:FkbM family methyltransferase [uncultured Xanthomonas sp.]|uniref:FkbM family methyltransferase n=1 Tax=uncultured Xanthomonas sp. TaxID=152831 RepID=UPI0025EA94A0|nr:FkbM family methyltransferase [uncultured Xanthomonas sp.]
MTIITGRHGAFETLPGDTVIADSLRWYGEWAENELELLRRFVSSGSVVADVGSFIGTHAIAFARAVGSVGHVHAFEPRRDAFSILQRNIEQNGLASQITAHNVGVSDYPGTISLDDTIDGTQNKGGLSLIDAGQGYDVRIITLDSLALSRLDLLKVDVEGMEAKVLIGATKTLQRCRPVIFAEFNSVDGAATTMAAVADLGYTAYGAIYPAFNPDNFNQCPDNFHGANAECGLLLIPSEGKQESLLTEDMRPIDSLEDIVALLLEKPQYLPEILPDAPEVTAVRRSRIEAPQPPAPASRPLHVVAPFYCNEHLVAPFMRGLRSVASELVQAHASVWLYNDSPDHEGLRVALAEAVAEGVPGVDVRTLANEGNLGFIGTCNRAFDRAIEEGADVLLLNSDTEVTTGAISEILAVSTLDPMIGFVCPRSNNATLATLPHSIEHVDVSAEQARSLFLPIARRLPRSSFIPTAVGFALWIRGTVLAEFGHFDTVYGKGYNEENDLIMRANRAGYRAALANHAFVWHQGEQSFSTTNQQRSEREQVNAGILRKRYPEYDSLIYRYFTSPEYRAERLLEALEPVDERRIIAFDFSSFGPFHNGTFESGIKLLSAAQRSWPQDTRIGVYISKKAWNFHGLDRLPGILRFEPNDQNDKVAAIVRIGQPYQTGTLLHLFETAPVVGIFMLDTISSDCGYLLLEFDEDIWRFALENMSVLFTNSQFTLDRIRTRYTIGASTLQRVSLHSLDPADYASYQPSDSEGSHILVIGNHYAHKFVRATTDALAIGLPDHKIIAIGYPDDIELPANVQSIKAGEIDEETFQSFYRDSKVVVFPSHYEGFGFPVLHALAHHRPVMVRDTGLNRELADHITASANIHRYETTQELLQKLQHAMPVWSDESRAGEVDGWRRSALEVHAALTLAMNQATGSQVASVLRRVDALKRSAALAAEMASSNAAMATSGQRAGRRLGHIIDRLLTIPGAAAAARFAARIYRSLRR